MKNNVHLFVVPFEQRKVLLLSDLHWDNPKCDRTLLKRNAYEESIGWSTNAKAEPFIDGKTDVIAGYGLEISCVVPYLESYCDIPRCHTFFKLRCFAFFTWCCEEFNLFDF